MNKEGVSYKVVVKVGRLGSQGGLVWGGSGGGQWRGRQEEEAHLAINGTTEKEFVICRVEVQGCHKVCVSAPAKARVGKGKGNGGERSGGSGGKRG